MNLCCPDQIIGATPAKIKWQVVRGDSSSLSILFYENDEETFIDTSGWSYISTAYDPITEEYYDLVVEPQNGGVFIYAEPNETELWGTAVAHRVAELYFDLEVTKYDGVVWTPVTGIISVLGDVTGGILS